MYYFCAKTSARKAYARITQNHITISFFLFSLIYCCAQCIIQSFLLSVDTQYTTLVSTILKGGNLPPQNFTFLQGRRGHLNLQICDEIPYGSVHPCTTIYDSSLILMPPVKPVLNRQPFVLESSQGNLNVTSILNPSNATQVIGVQITTFGTPVVNLTEQCVQTLLYPSQIMQSFTHEDMTRLCLQIWLAIVSLFAILNDSVPHTLAALVTHALETGWAMYATWRGPSFQANFQEILASPGAPCSLNLFSAYWKTRQIYEIIDVTLGSTGLFVFSYLSWTLLEVYNAQSFKCVGAPQHITRIHKFFMAVLVSLQLEVFVLVTNLGLWSKILTQTIVAGISEVPLIYKVLCIGTMILLLPWIIMGWYSIRREMKRMMIVFIGIAFLITISWSIVFYSLIYRWSFVQWPYLACFTVASIVLLIATMVLGVVCRMNFDKGLAQYLHAEATLSSLNFAPDSFLHDVTTSRKMDVHHLDMKVLDDQARSMPPTVYFISSLSKEDDSVTEQKV